MLDDKEREVFSVNVTWPQSQRDKWDKLVAMEMQMEAEKHEAIVRATARKENKIPLTKAVDLKKSLPEVGQLTKDLKSGLTKTDPNVASLKRAPSEKPGSLKMTTSRSAFREALPWRRSSEK